MRGVPANRCRYGCANCRGATRRPGTSRPRGTRATSSTTSRPRPASMVRIRRARRRRQAQRQRLEGSEEEEERKLSAGGLGADLGGGPDDGTQHYGRSRDEYGNGQHFHQVFITNVLLWPDVVRGLRPSLVSLRDLHSVSLAQKGLVRIAFPPFPSTSLCCRVGF